MDYNPVMFIKEFTAMRASQFFISTLKEAPADAEIISHKLMVRAGMIRRLGSGIYAYMPMGLRVIHKIENIIILTKNILVTLLKKMKCF